MPGTQKQTKADHSVSVKSVSVTNSTILIVIKGSSSLCFLLDQGLATRKGKKDGESFLWGMKLTKPKSQMVSSFLVVNCHERKPRTHITFTAAADYGTRE